MKKAPCKDCLKRHQGCHSECDEYKEFRKERDGYLEIKHKAIEDERAKYLGYNHTRKHLPINNKRFW